MGIEPAIDITAEQRKTVLSLLEKHLPNTTAWVYGSRAKWAARPQSDLDMVVFATPEQSSQVFELREAFEESNLPFRVDLFAWDDVPDRFRERIEAEYVVLVEEGGNGGGSERRKVPLDDVIDLVLSSVDKKTKDNERAVQLCNYTDVYYNSFIHANLDFMTATATDRETAKCSLFSGDVVITKDSEKHDDIGVPALVREDIPGLVCGYHLAILRPMPSKIEGNYLFYALCTSGVQHQFHSYANGITRFGLRKADIGLVEIPLPPLPEQRAIAHILGALDDKIELNRRMNETLEEMARALFKSWFVDFEPVRAKMEGRDTGLPPDVADLFPDRLVESELGEIPEGWEVGCLADIAVAPRRGVDPTSLDDETPYIGLEHMPRHSIALTQWEGAGKVTSSKSVFKKGEFLFGKLRPYFHKVGVAPVSGICSTDVIVVAPQASQWSSFVLASISLDEFVAYANQISTGTRMPRTSWKTMSEYRVCLPLAHAVQAFQDAVQPMIDEIVANVHGSHTLAALRDTLLPKLVSGEMRL